MNKKVVGVGAIVLVLGVALGFLAPSLEPLPFSYLNFTVQGGRSVAVNFTVPNSTSVFLYDVNFSSPINLYILTGNALRAWTGGLAGAESLEGSGALEILTNVTMLTVPGGGNGNLVYEANGSAASSYLTGGYSLVFDNSGGASGVGAHMAYIPPTTLAQLGNGSKVGGYLYSVGVMEFVFFIAMPIAGIAVMIYGAFRKPKAAAATDKAEADRLYKGIGGGQAGKPKYGKK